MLVYLKTAMRKFFLVATAFLLCACFSYTFGANQVECEQYEAKEFEDDVKLIICNMRTTTVIDSVSFEIANKRSDITALVFNGNPKIKFLPIRVGRSFENLEIVSASNCAVKRIIKDNFSGLEKLFVLILRDNKIETIKSDVFQHLSSLRMLTLEGNHLTQIDPKAFEVLSQITLLDLTRNICVDASFKNGENELQTVLGEVATKCKDESKNILNNNCGTVFPPENAAGLIINGVRAYAGQYPFLVALNNVKQDIFFCGGNLISSSHVLTAAHCIQQKDQIKAMNPDDISILLGRFDLQKRTEKHGSTQLVTEIHLHSDWNILNKKYDADIAILVTKTPVQFSTYIQPACLPVDPAIENISQGFVAGWGKTESNNFESIQRHAEMKAVDAATCYTNDAFLASIGSTRTFCAGAEKAGPCSGDSGGGFFVKFEGKWTLKGIVSSSTLNENFTCDVTRNAIFTEVTKFVDWIQDVCS